MKYLSRGFESKKKIKLLLRLTKIGEIMQGAIIDHLCKGLTIAGSAMLNNVIANNLSVAIGDLNAVAEIVEKINELNTHDISHTKLNKGE